MLRKFFILLLLLSFFSAFSQGMAKREALAKRFIRDAHTHLMMDTILWKHQANVSGHVDDYFKKYELDASIAEDYDFFQKSIQNQFTFARDNIYKQAIYEYKHHDYNSLQNYIKQIEKGKRKQVVKTSGLYSFVNNLLKKELSDIYKYSIPKYLEFIRKRRMPTPLVIKLNGKKISPKDIDLHIYAVTKNFDYQKVDILDRDKSLLLKPAGYTYKQIIKLVVEYKGQKFDFKPDKKIFDLPRKLTEVNNFMSKYSYEEIPEWKIGVSEKGNTVGIVLENVVQATIVKTKPVMMNNQLKDSIIKTDYKKIKK